MTWKDCYFARKAKRSMHDIIIYTRKFCGYCTAAKRLLEHKGLAFVEHDGTFDSDIRAEMISRANGARTFPQIFINEHHVGGCDDLLALERSGQLDMLLEGKAAS
jgi:glutaredoxin 3